jgi:hypothetical protein
MKVTCTGAGIGNASRLVCESCACGGWRGRWRNGARRSVGSVARHEKGMRTRKTVSPTPLEKRGRARARLWHTHARAPRYVEGSDSPRKYSTHLCGSGRGVQFTRPPEMKRYELRERESVAGKRERSSALH